MESFEERYRRIDRELAEKERQWIADCRARLPEWSEPRAVDTPCKPEEHIRATAKRRAFANWLWCAVLCYAWILAAMYYKYSR